jgi:hypothetical protein
MDGNPCEVSSAGNDDGTKLNIDDLVKRMREDGFTPEMANKLKDIRLYVCDAAKESKYRAYNFILQLGSEFNSLHVSYYNAVISSPMNGPHKFAASLSGSDQIDKILGRASAYKDTLLVRDVLLMHRQLENKFEIEIIVHPRNWPVVESTIKTSPSMISVFSGWISQVTTGIITNVMQQNDRQETRDIETNHINNRRKS